MRRVIAGVVVACVALACAYAIGVRMERAHFRTALVEAKQRADSLQGVVYARTAIVMQDSARLTAVVARWNAFADSVRRAPRVVRYLAGRIDTVPGPLRVDTVSADPVLVFADSTIRAVDGARRQCLSVLDTCTVALSAATSRAERAEADAARVRSADGRRARWRAVERGICGGSIAYNAWTVWGRE